MQVNKTQSKRSLDISPTNQMTLAETPWLKQMARKTGKPQTRSQAVYPLPLLSLAHERETGNEVLDVNKLFPPFLIYFAPVTPTKKVHFLPSPKTRFTSFPTPDPLKIRFQQRHRLHRARVLGTYHNYIIGIVGKLSKPLLSYTLFISIFFCCFHIYIIHLITC